MANDDDTLVSISSVAGDDIYAKSLGAAQGSRHYTFEICSRVPIVGWDTFDFTNDDGVLSGIHVGHGVMNIIPGAPAPQALHQRALFELQFKTPRIP